MMNMLSGSPGMKAVERAVEAAILEEFREIDRLGGVLAAVEHRYQRSQIQTAAHRYEQQIYDGNAPDHRAEQISRRERGNAGSSSSSARRGRSSNCRSIV